MHSNMSCFLITERCFSGLTTRLPTTTTSNPITNTEITLSTAKPDKTSSPQSPTMHPMRGCKGQTCPSDGSFPGPEPCSPDFCTCSHGVAHPMVCHQGLVFNQAHGVCDWPWATDDCYSTSTTTATFNLWI